MYNLTTYITNLATTGKIVGRDKMQVFRYKQIGFFKER